MTMKLPTPRPLYNFLRRQFESHPKKTPRKVFTFANPEIRAARKKPLER